MTVDRISGAIAGCLTALAVLLPAPAATAQTDIKMIGFGGATNLPAWIAIDKGIFKKHGLNVTLEQTPGSQEQMRWMMEGKFHFASTAFDNIVAYTEGEGRDKLEGYDVVAIMGVHSGLNSIVARPEIKSYADIKGKAMSVDSPKSGYATMLYEIVKKKTGMVQEKDYSLIQVGGTDARMKSLREGTSVIAAISSPQDLRLKADGFTILGDAAEEIGAYQGSAYAVRKSWAKANEKEVVAYIKAVVEATDWLFANKAEAIAVMRGRLKNLDEKAAEEIYTRMAGGSGGLNKGAVLNVKGVDTVLRLRRETGSKASPSERYIDTSFYQKATGKKL